MLEIYDTCNIGLRKDPSGGVVLMFTDITGREGIALMIPIEGKERTQQLVDGIQELIGPKVQTADLTTMRRVVKDDPRA